MMRDNPYQTPKSYIDGKSETELTHSLRFSLLWKIYFWIFSVLLLLGLLSFLYDDNSGVAEIISSITILFSTVGLFGYIYRKKILNYKVWKIFFYSYLVWTVMYDFVSNIDPSAGMSTKMYIIALVFSWTISIPSYVALFFYGRKSCTVWKINS